MKELSLDFDCLKVQQNPKQAAATCGKAVLSDDDLENVSGAGDAFVPTVNPEVMLGRHDYVSRC